MKKWFLLTGFFCVWYVPAAHGGEQIVAARLMSDITQIAQGIDRSQQAVEDAASRVRLQRAAGKGAAQDRRQLRSKARELESRFGSLAGVLKDIEHELARAGRHDLLRRHQQAAGELEQRIERIRGALANGAEGSLPETGLPFGRVSMQREREDRLYGRDDDPIEKRTLGPGTLLGPTVEPLRRAPRKDLDQEEAGTLLPSGKAFALAREQDVFRLVSFERDKSFETTAPAANTVNEIVRFDLDLPAGARPLLVAGLGDLQGLLSQAALQAVSLPAAQDFAADGRSVVITPEISALAEDLGKNPVRMYEYVKNTVMYQPYWGALKGAAGTLAQKSGNDADQASLLIALLRASGYAARYGRALVTVDIERAKQWLGVEDDTCVDWMLATAGVPGTTALIDKAGKIRAVRFEHIFVEAYLPYADYRGSAETSRHKLWVPLAPAFKQRRDLAGTDITELVDFDAEALADYLQAGVQRNQDGSYTGFDAQYLQEQIADYVRRVLDYLKSEGITLRELTGYEEIIPQSMEILPITLPFTSTNTTVFSALPDDLHYLVRVRLAGSNGIELAESRGELIIDWQASFVDLGVKRLTLSWQADTEEDITQMPSYLVDMTPQVRIAGVVAAQGPACMLGSEAVLRVQIVSPGAQFPLAHSYDYRLAAGDYTAIVPGVDAVTGEHLMRSAARLQEAVDARTGERDPLVGEYLYLTGMLYHYRLGLSEKQTARLHRVHHFRKPSALICNAHLDMLRVAGDFPLSIRGYRLIFDFGNNYSMVIPKTADIASRLRCISAIGPEMSALEHVVLQEMFLSEAVSAVKLLDLANDQGMPICDITPDNRAAMMAQLDLPAEDLSMIGRELDRKQRVTVTKTRLSAGTYTGAPIISLPFDETDPYASVRSGYFISGPANGAELYDMVKDWLTKKGYGGWFDYAENKKNVIQDIVTDSDKIVPFVNYIGSIIYNACTTVWKQRFPRGYVFVDSLTQGVFWRYVGLGSLIIYIDFEDNIYFVPNAKKMRQAKYVVRNMYGGVPVVNDPLIPEVSALNGKNFKGYADEAQGSVGDFYFFDNETKIGETLKVQLLLNYRSPMCLNEYNTTTTVGTFKAGPIDLDIDSNNDNGFDNPDCSLVEDNIEDKDGLPETPGKVMGVNDWDADGDDIPNFADGFSTGAFDNTGDDAGGQFVPVIIEFAPDLDLEKTYVTFSYSESDPNGVQREDGRKENTYIYIAAQGHMRLWTKNGEEARNPAEVNQGGDFVKAGSEYKASDLGPGSKITLYVEAVNPSLALADQSIKVSCTAYDAEGEVVASGEDTVKVTIVKIGMGVEGNRDEEIKFDDPEDKKYEFWVNSDHDVEKDGEEDDADDNTQDSADDIIKPRRDLEDFSRLLVSVPQILENFNNVTYCLQFENLKEGKPKINLFNAIDETQGYLKTQKIADRQVREMKIMEASEKENFFPDNTILPGTDKSFIFEGVQEGEGNLTFIVKLNGQDACKQTVRLTLRDIETFYRKWLVAANEETDIVNIPSSVEFVDESKYEYKPETNDFVLFVHGWNMQDYEKKRFAETMFKRLWWQGYKGHMAYFDWPTLTYPSWLPVPPPSNYDRSDFRAYQSAWYLKNILEWLETSDYVGRVRVLAHSMGNQAIGEALRLLPQGNWVHTYIASQAAVSGHTYAKDLSDYDTAPFRIGFGPTTPEVIRYFSCGKDKVPDCEPYYKANIAKVGKAHRYFNPDDYALDAWEINNYTKPNNSTAGYNYRGNDTSYSPIPQGEDSFYQSIPNGCDERGYPVYIERNLNIEEDLERYEIFSYCAESRARALGALITTPPDFQDFSLKFWLGYDDGRYSHSRQFRSNIIDEWGYWSKFMADCGLK